jgi:ABC-type nickel/cobalt efflux system permease component RcnA
VPTTSISNTLLSYPTGMLSQPLGTIHATFTATPSPTTAGAAQSITDAPGPAAAIKRGTVLFPGLQQWLSTLMHRHDPGVWTGALAVLVSLLLGAGHALLPGHAKLVMAVGMSERGGRTKDAIAAGTVVTATHTAGVLLTGLAITTSMALAGDRLLNGIQAAGGLIIAGLGLGLVITATKRLRGRRHGDHTHDRGHPHRHGHEHSHQHHGSGRLAVVTSAIAGGLVPSPSALVMLLGAVAIGRTLFGVLLVIGYGLGMALTLSAVGLIFATGGSRLSAAVERVPHLRNWTGYGTLVTASAVLAVGLIITFHSGMA